MNFSRAFQFNFLIMYIFKFNLSFFFLISNFQQFEAFQLETRRILANDYEWPTDSNLVTLCLSSGWIFEAKNAKGGIKCTGIVVACLECVLFLEILQGLVAYACEKLRSCLRSILICDKLRQYCKKYFSSKEKIYIVVIKVLNGNSIRYIYNLI